MLKKRAAIFAVLICLLFQNTALATLTKYPDYADTYLGEDKWENFNRKMFNFNLKLNKYVIRPIHVLWASVMPEYGMERIQYAAHNIEYPIRLISTLIQKDFTTSKNETIRFFTNTILGLGGMYNPAKHIFKLESEKENMDQALAKCKLKPGPYFVLPVLSFTSLRGVFGKILDTALNPGSYIATPILAMVKAGLTVNKTSYLQPLIKMIESNFADPYEIAKDMFALETYIRCANLDRIDLTQVIETVKENETTKLAQKPAVEIKKAPTPNREENLVVKTEVSSEIYKNEQTDFANTFEDYIKNYNTENYKPSADIFLLGYSPQTPVVDSMRTALFENPEVKKSFWNELSLWNRSFNNRIKTSSVSITENKDNYKFRYIMQKDKNSPVAIIYPSIGEGIMSGHSVMLAKLFYDAGYSIIIQGSHFQWEFVKSMPNDYRPGLPEKDAICLKTVTSKILNLLEEKYDCKFENKVFIGTSFGALTTLFIASGEAKENTLGNTKYISICPPIELTYAIKQIDKNSEQWQNSDQDLKNKIASTAAKVLELFENKDDLPFDKDDDTIALPFTDEEGKLITGFIMHQKLSDLIFTIENGSKSKKDDIYQTINNMNYQDYADKYLSDKINSKEQLAEQTSLFAITDFLRNNDNYKIYHSLNDYLTNTNQLKKLKQLTGNKTVLLDNGAHLGFLYRKEFIEDLIKTISLKY